MSTTIRMDTLVKAHASLALVQSVLENLPIGVVSHDVWISVMQSRIALETDLRMLNPVEVKGVPHEQA